MFNHEPAAYSCPMCKLAQGEDTEVNTRAHIVYEDATTLAYVSPKWWINNPGNVLVIPKQHTENIYDISDEVLSDVYKVAKKIALAIRQSYPSDGTSMRQHNEPAGNQDVWHFHVHVFPRFENDQLYQNHDQKRWATNEERMVFVEKLALALTRAG